MTGRRGDEATGRKSRVIWLLLVSLSPCLPFVFAACGKIGDPLPPIPRSRMIIEELSVAQQGSQLVLSFPFTRTPRTRLQRVDVYRLVESANAPLGLTADSFSERATIINSVPADRIPLNQSAITYNDALDLENGQRNSRYRYAVRLVNLAGQAADFSNYAMVTPLFDLARPPAILQAAQRETEIVITWDRPAVNESGTTPANVAAYNLYRREGDSLTKINQEPLVNARFIDRNFQFGTEIQYVARSLSLPPNTSSLSAAIESNDSVTLAHTPKDTFPPAPPKPITIASINASVSLFWPLNAEPDVAGYNVYRADDEDAPPDKWIKLNPQLHMTASFRDERVQVGKKYFYQITAVDAYGNESARSETVSETVAP